MMRFEPLVRPAGSAHNRLSQEGEMLTGQAKTDYQRDYLRERRATVSSSWPAA
jgi:hypothetical protein